MEFQIKLLYYGSIEYNRKFNICSGFILFFFLFKHQKKKKNRIEKRTTITDRLVHVIALCLFRLIIYMKIVTQNNPNSRKAD